MKKKGLLVLLVGICLIMVSISCSQSATTSSPSQKVITLVFNHFEGPDSRANKDIFVPFAKDIEKASNGRVKIEIYPGSPFGGPTGAWERVVSGTTDLELIGPSFAGGRFPILQIMEVPFLGIKTATQLGEVFGKLDAKFPSLRAERAGAKWLLYMFTEPAPILTVKKPVRTMEDLKGLKLQVGSKMQSEALKLLGGVPIAMPITDVYLSMQKGVIDGMMGSVLGDAGFRLMEVANCYTYTYTAGFTMGVIMNQDKWDSLPADVQNAINKAILPWNRGEELANKVVDDESKQVFARAEKAGKTVSQVSHEEWLKWQQVCLPVHKMFVEDMKPLEIPAQEMLDEILRLVAAK